MTQTLKRDRYFDFLRAIGLISIILVHSTNNEAVLKLNLFNVPLMVFVSGLVASTVNRNDILAYYWKRVKRLIIPTYIFILFFFLFLYVLKFLKIADIFEFSIHNILCSLLLLDKNYGGIGFVWVMRIFLLMAIASPFVVYASTKIKDWIYFLLMVVIIAIQYLLCAIDVPAVKENIFFDQYLLYTLGYLPFLLGGVKMKDCSPRFSVAIIIIMIVYIVLMLSFNNDIRFLDLSHKYPPREDFIVYGIMASMILLLSKKLLHRISNYSFFQFVGKNTMWIYWWHVPIVLTLNSILKNNMWPIVFIFTLFTACILFYFQYKIVDKTNKRFPKKYLIG